MSAASRRLGQGLLLLLLPALTLVATERLQQARGPLYFGPNQDPSYSYLIGSLQLATTGSTPFFHHPGLPTQGLGAAVFATLYLTSGEQDGFARDVLSRPERYLRALQLATLAAVLAGLAGAAFLMARRGDLVAALLLQTSPWIGAVSLSSLSLVSPEPILLLATVALSVTVWHFAAAPPDDERRVAIVLGALAAVAVSSRISALPFLLIPPLLLTTWRGRGVFAAVAAAAGALSMLLITGHWWAFLGWARYLGQRTGTWGSEPRSVLDPGLYLEGLKSLFDMHHATFAVLALGAAVWIWHRSRRERGDGLGRFHRALGAVLLAQAAMILLVSKNPAARYMVPATALASLDLVLIWSLLDRGGRARGWRRPIIAALLLAAPVALELPRHRQELRFLHNGVAGQREIAAEIDRLPADCTVATFFRASSLPYALYFGQRLQPRVFTDVLAELYPDQLFYSRFGRNFVDFTGGIPAAEVARKHPCLYLHGMFRGELADLVIRRTQFEVLYSVPSVDAVMAAD